MVGECLCCPGGNILACICLFVFLFVYVFIKIGGGGMVGGNMCNSVCVRQNLVACSVDRIIRLLLGKCF